ncbi:hypothetical protein EDM53_02010 [Rickettsiales endosymbiont of Peranema trichophorum]|nr:hypothetical protein EDM53_02010 [Rickettsiales endosymbiont of Peranema trichophorum]
MLTCCATLISGTSQNISVKVVDSSTNENLADVKCTVTDGKGLTYVLNTNPGHILVHKGNGPLHPDCRKEGYVQKSFGMGDSFNAVTIANVLFWPGFIVDAASGAMKDYPSHMTIIMERKKQ